MSRSGGLVRCCGEILVEALDLVDAGVFDLPLHQLVDPVIAEACGVGDLPVSAPLPKEVHRGVE